MEKSFDNIKPQVSAEPTFKKQKSAQVDKIMSRASLCIKQKDDTKPNLS